MVIIIILLKLNLIKFKNNSKLLKKESTTFIINHANSIYQYKY